MVVTLMYGSYGSYPTGSLMYGSYGSYPTGSLMYSLMHREAI